jgi:hypothetical protein
MAKSFTRTLLQSEGYAQEQRQPPAPPAAGDATPPPPPPPAAAGDTTPPPPAGAAAAPPPAMDDAAVLAYLNKQHGTTFTSLDQIKTPAAHEDPPPPPSEEERQKMLLERKTKVRAFGLNSNKVTAEDLDNYAQDTALSPYDSGLKRYSERRLAKARQNLKEGESLPTEEELTEDFEILYNQNRTDSDPLRQQADELLQEQHDAWLEQKYKNVLSLDTAYEEEERTTSRRQKYNGLVTKAIEKLGRELTHNIKDNEEEFSYKYGLSDDTVTALQKTYLSDEMFSNYGNKELSVDKMVAAMRLGVLEREFPQILATVANAHKSEALKRRGLNRIGAGYTGVNAGMGGGAGYNEQAGKGANGQSYARQQIDKSKNDRY